MGSYTKFNGTVTFTKEDGSVVSPLPERLIRAFATDACDIPEETAKNPKMLDKAFKAWTGVQIKDNTFKFVTEWKNAELPAFFTSIARVAGEFGYVTNGFIEARHEYGDIYAVNIENNQVEEIEAELVYKNKRGKIIKKKVMRK